MHELIKKFVLDTENPWLNFLLAREYHELGHTASAVSHYLRCAERTKNDLLAYECFLHMHRCFFSQRNKRFTAKHLLLQAICILPKRPEAYYLLSRFYENTENYYECYSTASLGLEICSFTGDPLKTSVGYPGMYGLLFEKALAAWHWDKPEESKELFLQLKNEHILSNDFLEAVESNLKSIG